MFAKSGYPLMINEYSSSFNEFENQKGSIKIRLERNDIAKRDAVGSQSGRELSIIHRGNDPDLFYETAIYAVYSCKKVFF